MEEEIQTLETNPGEGVNAPSEGTQNEAPQTTAVPALTLDEINEITKHSYPNLEEAKKGLINLKNLVGAKEVPVTDPSLVETVQTLQKQVNDANFYAEHPELKPHRDIIAKFGNPEQAIKDPVVKKIIDAVSREESSLQSNARIGQVSSDYETDLAAAKSSGNWGEFLAKHKGVGPKKE